MHFEKHKGCSTLTVTFSEEWLKSYYQRQGKEPPPAQSMSKSNESRRSKYGNRKTMVDGKTFDSKHEAEVYEQLKVQVLAGECRAVACQVPFALPGRIKYVADFVLLHNDGRYSVLDAKSEATRKDKVYRMKKRLMRECLGLEIQEV